MTRHRRPLGLTIEGVGFTVEDDTASLRADHAVRVMLPGLDRQGALRALKRGAIQVNGRPATLQTVVKLGDRLEAKVSLPLMRPSASAAAAQGFRVLHLDEHLCVVNKPAGMATHPAAGVPEGETLVECAASHLKAQGVTPQKPPAAAGRLDKGTSGVVILTLSRAAEKGMARAFEDNEVHKEYLALCRGVTPNKFDVAQPVVVTKYKPGVDKVKKVKEAETHFERVAHSQTESLVRVFPKTGRMHQIRKHLRAASHPIVGDGRYGLREDRQAQAFFLHCAKVTFEHPVSHQKMTFTLPLPSDFQERVHALNVRP